MQYIIYVDNVLYWLGWINWFKNWSALARNIYVVVFAVVLMNFSLIHEREIAS